MLVANLLSLTHSLSTLLSPGMAMGATRHIADMRVDPASREGQNVLGLQTGWNKGASQKGMSFGTVRHIHDIKVGREREKRGTDHDEYHARARQSKLVDG